MFVIIVESLTQRGRKYFVHKGLRDVAFDYREAIKHRSRARAQGSALLFIARRPNYIGHIKVCKYVSGMVGR